MDEETGEMIDVPVIQGTFLVQGQNNGGKDYLRQDYEPMPSWGGKILRVCMQFWEEEPTEPAQEGEEEKTAEPINL